MSSYMLCFTPLNVGGRISVTGTNGLAKMLDISKIVSLCNANSLLNTASNNSLPIIKSLKTSDCCKHFLMSGGKTLENKLRV